MDLNSNRSKGVNAYIAPVVPYSGKVETDRAIYPQPKPGQEDASHRGKFFKGEVDESRLPDGWYCWKEAVFQSTKSNSGLVKIERGEIVEECSSTDELLILICDEYFPKLPPLIGSPKQVDWAEKLRAKYLLQLWELGYNGGDFPSGIVLQKSPNEAKWWIESGSYAPIRDWINAALAVVTVVN